MTGASESEADPRIEAFFDKATHWPEELRAVREILRAGPLTEEFKWRSPCYTFQGGNVATVWGLKEACALSFFKGVLLKDPEGALVAPGENSRSVRMFKFTGLDEIEKLRDTIAAYVREAVELEKAGATVTFEKDDLGHPRELTDRLDADGDFRAAFESLTPGRRRGWVLHFSQPRQAKTRASRIDKAAEKILAGKGMHDR